MAKTRVELESENQELWDKIEEIYDSLSELFDDEEQNPGEVEVEAD